MVPTETITTAVPRPRGAARTTATALADASLGTPKLTEAAGAAGRWLAVLRHSFWAILAVSGLCAAIAAVRGILTQGDLIYTDAILLYQAMRFRDGAPVYMDVNSPPFLVMIYWPLLPLVTGWLAYLADLGAAGTLYLIRSLTLLSTLAVGATVAVLVSMLGGRREAAIAAAGLFLTAYVVHPWAYTARADMAALAPVLLGCLVLLRWRSPAAAILAGALMGAGFASKQTFVVGVTAATLLLLWRREWVRMAAVIVGWCLVVGTIATVMTVQTNGRFLEQTFASNVLPFSLARLFDRLSVYLPMSLPFIALAVLGWRGAVAGKPMPRLLCIYVGLAALAGLASVGRIGSHYNYLLETTALLCVFAGAGFERCLQATQLSRSSGLDGPAPRLAAWSVLVTLVVTLCAMGAPLAVLAVRAGSPPDSSALIRMLRDVEGPVLTERDGTAAALAGKTPIAGDPVQLAVMTSAGRLDPAPLNEYIRSKQLSLIALSCLLEDVPTYDEFDWWPAGTRESIKASYRFSRVVDGYALYVPAVDGETPVGPMGSDDRLRKQGTCRDPR